MMEKTDTVRETRRRIDCPRLLVFVLVFVLVLVPVLVLLQRRKIPSL